jgi:transposase
MKATYKITQENAKTARQLIASNNYPTAQMRFLVIALRGEGEKISRIAEITNFSTRQVSRIITKFSDEGFKALTKKKHKGNHRTVTEKEERNFFKKYKKQAKEGRLITAKDMWKDFCESFNCEITQKAFYRVLARNGWRKVMPRLQHPKAADAKTKRASKKLNPFIENQGKHFIWGVDEER